VLADLTRDENTAKRRAHFQALCIRVK